MVRGPNINAQQVKNVRHFYLIFLSSQDYSTFTIFYQSVSFSWRCKIHVDTKIHTSRSIGYRITSFSKGMYMYLDGIRIDLEVQRSRSIGQNMILEHFVVSKVTWVKVKGHMHRRRNWGQALVHSLCAMCAVAWIISIKARLNVTLLQWFQEIVMNIDLAPTFIELAGGTPPDYMDGQSLKGILHATHSDKPLGM